LNTRMPFPATMHRPVFSRHPLWTVIGLGLALQACSLVGQTIVFNELHYHPASERLGEEFLELHNPGPGAVNLAGCQLVRGVAFTFPTVSVLPGGFLVVAADTNAFRAAHPGFSGSLVGNWSGSLSDRGESLELVDPAGTTIERIRYATQGDWGERGLGPLDQGFRGLEWLSGHDGLGKTLERVNPSENGSIGQNWRSSVTVGGSPGAANSAFTASPAPFITEVGHSPAVPRSTSSVTISARISGPTPPIEVALLHRPDGVAQFATTVMLDDGLHGDGLANDGLFGVQLPAQPDGTVVEYYVRATGGGNLVRTSPAPLIGGEQSANALFQVDDSPDGSLPRFRVVVTEKDRQMLSAIEAQPWYLTGDAQVNATLVITENGVASLRHGAGFRIRGNTSRDINPPSRRIALPDDRTWQDQRVITLNGVHPPAQVGAAALMQLAGLPAARSRLAELRENGVARTGVGSPVAGLYAQNETLNGDFADAAFPTDSNGNLYRVVGYGSLDYLGESADAYRHPEYYTKETNDGLDDWTDLIRLTRILNQTPAPDYVNAVREVADTEEWVRYFAANTLLANYESTLSNPRVTVTPTNTVVVTGDYYLYRGETDPRFRLVPYDLDACLGADGAFTAGMGLYTFLGVPAVNRFFQEPAFAARYQAEVRRLADGVFLPANVDALLDRLLAPHVPDAALRALKDFNVSRRNFVLANLPAATRVTTVFPAVGGYPQTTSPTATLAGVASGAGVVALRVSGTPAIWDATQGKWSADVALLPGLNRLLIESLDAAGNVIHTQPFDLWREAPEQVVNGPLLTDTVWRAADGPFRVDQTLLVPAGIALTIEPGTSVQFAAGAGLLVKGRLLAEGTSQRRIQMLMNPRLAGRWKGIGFDGATNENRLTFADLRACQRALLQTTNSDVRLEHLEWPGHQANVLVSFNSSLTVRHCIFPTMAFDEAVGGLGIPANGHVIFEGNVFGSTTGYADIVDFSGGTRPGPIPQFLNNVFLGGSDDGLDLDGSDAHIEGNVFMHFHKNNSETSSAAAIGTGRGSKGEVCHLTVVRNVFFDNDHDLILKEFAEVTARNNTFVGTKIGSLAFSEPLRPGGNPAVSVRLRDSIWWNCASVFFGLDQNLFTNDWFDVQVDNSIFNEPGPWTGTNNLALDPLFVNSTNDFHLRAASPALGRALGGLDLGAMVPAGAVILGAPSQPTAARDATLQVIGAGLTHYRFALDDDGWSDPRPLETSVQLTGLALGTHRLRVSGLNSANVWQPEPGTVVEWEVVGDFAGVRLNELLAENGGAVPVGAQTPDLVELFNPGNLARDLSGMSLTDDPGRPRKFVFPNGTVLPPGSYLTLYADSRSQPPGLHLGFAFDNDGEQALLFERSDLGGTLVDRVDFGAQLSGLSLGRGRDGGWTLCRPTFGSANEPVQLGDPRRVRLNEWLANPGALDGDDFIELFNAEDVPVDLSGLSLTDALGGAPRRAPIFPHTFVTPRGFLSLTADGSSDRAGRLDLSLASDFGSLALTDSRGEVVDSVIYGSQPIGQSEGRWPDGFGTISRFAGSSLGLSNGVAPRDPPTLGWRLDTVSSTLAVTFVGQVVGQRLRLESAPAPSGAWSPVLEFTADSVAEGSIPVSLQSVRLFFRMVVVE
jgi:hypothetical protein